MIISRAKKQLRDKLQYDIQDLSPELQKRLHQWFMKWKVTEEDIISEIDDMDAKVKMLRTHGMTKDTKCLKRTKVLNWSNWPNG